MTKEQFKQWLAKLKYAWESKKPEEATALYAGKCLYHESPFTPPYTNQEQILELWRPVPMTQDKINVEFEIFAVTEDIGITRWMATYDLINQNKHVKADGIYVVHLNDVGLCDVFRRWKMVE